MNHLTNALNNSNWEITKSKEAFNKTQMKHVNNVNRNYGKEKFA